MPEYQPLDYRLRVATKRTDLPEDVIRLLADAYYETCLNKKLRDERDEARRLYCEEWAFTIELERGEAGNPFDLAEEKGWDCYKENTNEQ